MTDRIDVCPHCGFANGVYSIFTGHQFYSLNGDEAGYEIENANEGSAIYCASCNKKIGKLVDGKPKFFNVKSK